MCGGIRNRQVLKAPFTSVFDTLLSSYQCIKYNVEIPCRYNFVKYNFVINISHHQHEIVWYCWFTEACTEDCRAILWWGCPGCHSDGHPRAQSEWCCTLQPGRSPQSTGENVMLLSCFVRDWKDCKKSLPLQTINVFLPQWYDATTNYTSPNNGHTCASQVLVFSSRGHHDVCLSLGHTSKKSVTASARVCTTPVTYISTNVCMPCHVSGKHCLTWHQFQAKFFWHCFLNVLVCQNTVVWSELKKNEFWCVWEPYFEPCGEEMSLKI